MHSQGTKMSKYLPCVDFTFKYRFKKVPQLIAALQSGGKTEAPLARILGCSVNYIPSIIGTARRSGHKIYTVLNKRKSATYELVEVNDGP